MHIDSNAYTQYAMVCDERERERQKEQKKHMNGTIFGFEPLIYPEHCLNIYIHFFPSCSCLGVVRFFPHFFYACLSPNSNQYWCFWCLLMVKLNGVCCMLYGLCIWTIWDWKWIDLNDYYTQWIGIILMSIYAQQSTPTIHALTRSQRI